MPMYNNSPNQEQSVLVNSAKLSAIDLACLQNHLDWPLIDNYCSTLISQRHYSLHTLRAYGHALAELARLSKQKHFADLTNLDIRQAISQARASKLSARAIAHRLSVWRSFLRWLAQRLPMASNPVNQIRLNRLPRMLPKAIAVDEAQSLFKELPAVNSKKALSPIMVYRDRALLELFYSSGLRLAELISLDYQYLELGSYRSQSWLNLAEAEVTITGKGNRRRNVPVGKAAIKALQDWLSVRGQLAVTGQTALFLSSHKKRISSSAIRIIVKQAAIKSGLSMHLHPHMLRHSFASHMLQSSGDIRAVQEMLGHQSIASTQAYTALDFQYLAKVYDQAHPRAQRQTDDKEN